MKVKLKGDILEGYLRLAGLTHYIGKSVHMDEAEVERQEDMIRKQHPDETSAQQLARARVRLVHQIDDAAQGVKAKKQEIRSETRTRNRESGWVRAWRIAVLILLVLIFGAIAAHGQGRFQPLNPIGVLHKIQDEGTDVVSRTGSGLFGVNFIGAGSTCVFNATTGLIDCTITSGGADGVGYDEILDEASGLTKRAQVNFIGGGVSCVDNVPSTRTDCTIAGGGTTHDILSGTHTDTTAAAVVRGDLMTGQTAAPTEWTRLAVGGADTFLGSDGTDAAWTALVLASSQFANQGTTTTVAHGNAAGNPSWSQVVPADMDLTQAYAFSSTSNTFVGASYTSADADPADGGILRAGNAEDIFCSELATPGVDLCLQLDASDIFQGDGTWNFGTLTEGGSDVIHKGTNTFLSTENIILDGSANPRDITLGIIRILQTPNMDSTRGIAIITDAAGFGDTKALEVDWTATGVAAGDFEAVIDLDIDTANSSGGNIIGLEITATDTGSAVTYGMLSGVGVNPILNEAGSFGNIETAFTFDSVFTDVTADFNSTASDVQMFVSNGDLVYIGMAALFDEVEFILAVTASNAGIQPTFEYSDGASGWITFSPTDNTNGMRQNGDLVWIATSLAGWAQDTVNAVSGKFWIRITRGAVTVATPPTEDLVQVNNDLEFIWDSSGNLNVASVSSGFNAEIADAGFIRCANNEICVAWELATPGADKTLIVDASDILQLNGTFNATALTQGGTAVVLETRTLTGGDGINTLGDLSANRTVSIDLNATVDGVGSASNLSGMEITATGELALLQDCADTQILKYTTTGDLWECQNDNDSGGALAWEALVNTADTATSYLSNNTAETVTFSFESAFGASQQFLVRQQTGNPTAGTLLDVRAADTDVTVFRAGDGTNGITVSQAGALTAEGTGAITATDLAANAIGSTTDFDPTLCAASEILERQGAVWACTATPAGGNVDLLDGSVHQDTAAGTAVQGDIITVPVSGNWTRLGVGGANTFLGSDATDATWTALVLASAQFANQGTTTTLLHGNAAGNPSFGAVVLTTDVSGILPGANGGTNNDFMDFTGPTTSLKTFTLPDATSTILTDNAAVTVAQGGTGLTSGTSGGVPYFNATTTMASSALLDANELIVGGGAGVAPSTPIGLGTTTTVLHGNAGGAPSFGAVSLTADVSGVLPNANGGTGDDTSGSTGVARVDSGNWTYTELSGDVATSGSNATLIQAGVVASAELATPNKTFDKSIDLIDPTTAEDDLIQWMHRKAVTYTDVDCSTDTGTVTIDMDHRVITTPNTVGTDILTGTIVCDTDNQADGGFADATIPADVPVNLSITATSGSPGVVRIHVGGTVD